MSILAIILGVDTILLALASIGCWAASVWGPIRHTFIWRTWHVRAAKLALAVFLVFALSLLNACSSETEPKPEPTQTEETPLFPAEDDPATPYDDRYYRELTPEEVEEIEEAKQ